ncbi:MAG TPA: response regulator transcription factor [Acidimicrobiales bacterium]|nr:response regulator transcription factor [Acidimicrobiales bacterium]
MASQIRTLIVDDQSDVRLLLRTVIDRANAGLSVVAEASSGEEALEQVEMWNPLVVVLDEMMAEMSGLDTAAALRARRPSQILVLCSAYLDEDVIARAREIGIDAWVSKDALRELPGLIRNLVCRAG